MKQAFKEINSNNYQETVFEIKQNAFIKKLIQAYNSIVLGIHFFTIMPVHISRKLMRPYSQIHLKLSPMIFIVSGPRFTSRLFLLYIFQIIQRFLDEWIWRELLQSLALIKSSFINFGPSCSLTHLPSGWTNYYCSYYYNYYYIAQRLTHYITIYFKAYDKDMRHSVNYYSDFLSTCLPSAKCSSTQITSRPDIESWNLLLQYPA